MYDASDGDVDDTDEYTGDFVRTQVTVTVRLKETSWRLDGVGLARHRPPIQVPLQKFPHPPQWLCLVLVLKQPPLHRFGRPGGQNMDSKLCTCVKSAVVGPGGGSFDASTASEGTATSIAAGRVHVDVELSKSEVVRTWEQTLEMFLTNPVTHSLFSSGPARSGQTQMP